MAYIEELPNSRMITRETRPLFCFLILCLAMFLNLLLAFLHAHGLPVSNAIVTAIQLLVTLIVIPAFFSRKARIADYAYLALGFIVFSAILTNILNPTNLKTIYDVLVIPIFIAWGMLASSVKPKWMHRLLIFVVLSALFELILPSAYASLVDPLGYLSATRGWMEDVAAKAGTGDQSLDWVNRSGGSKLGLFDHRVGGAFLEPLSLGYFGAIMAIYYAGMYRGSAVVKVAALIACLFLTLAADSRVPTILIFINSLLLLSRLRLPPSTLWLTFPAIFGVAYLIYVIQPESLYSDAGIRLSLTFKVMEASSFYELMTGGISLERVGDSGIVYLLRCLGPIGMMVAIWFFSGAFVKWRGTNVGVFVAISAYLTVTLMFGGATISIKTASLLGYLVGLAARFGNEASADSTRYAMPLDDGGVMPDGTKVDLGNRQQQLR